MMDIRELTAGDAAEWARMREALWPSATAAEHHTELALWLERDDRVVLVAVREPTRLAGFAEVGTRSVADGCDTSPVAYLEGWYVDADVRRQGVGAALIRAGEAWARRRGFLQFASDVEATNEASQLAHAALGFEEVSRVVTYRKTLDPSVRAELLARPLK
jgi:aminoglycoside 6'-N-acetyltransferase I